MDTNKHKPIKISQSSMNVIICALFTTFVIGINLFVNQIPVDKTKLDTTEIGLHTLSENTKEILLTITDEIDIYRICQPGKEDATLTDMLERYNSLSPNLNVKTIDPAVYPDFELNYTSEKLTDNSIIVSSSKRSQVIDYSNIATYTAFNGEDYITSAIKYVTTDSLPVLYSLEGHGEKQPDDALISTLNKNGIELKSLNLLSLGTIPEDAQGILIYAPSSDINANEAAEIIKYIENSGRLILITDYNSSELKNISSIMSYYGVYTIDGVVMESSPNKSLSGYPYYVLPETNNKNDITKVFKQNSSYILMPLSQAIAKNSNIRDTVTITELLTTSNDAYIVTDSTYEKADVSVSAPYSLAVLIEEKYDNNDTKIVWITNSVFIEPNSDQMVGGTNSQFLVNAINYISGNKISISSGKSTSVGTLTINTSQSRMWKIILTGFIPAAVIIIGIGVWYRRKRL